MRIGLLSPSIYMSLKRYGKMIFAPRDLAIALADGLVSKGHKVFFFSTSDVASKATVISGDDFLLDERAKPFDLKSKFSPGDLWRFFYLNKTNYELDLTKKAYLFAKENKIDIIHSFHENMAHYFDGLTDVPTVYTLHGPLPSVKNINYWFLNKFKDHKYVSISLAFRRADSVKLNYVGNVYNGIDTGLYKYSRTGGKYLSFIGRMVVQKGADLAIKISNSLSIPLKIATSKKATDVNVRFYEEKVTPSFTRKNIRFCGFLQGERKVDFLQNSRLLLFPIKWEEPFGLVMIEAMATGTPVVAFARGSVPEVVKDGETGFIINSSPLDVHGEWIIKKTGMEGLCEAVKRIYSMPPEEYQKMRLASRAHVEKNFTVGKMVEGYEAVYEKILNR